MADTPQNPPQAPQAPSPETPASTTPASAPASTAPSSSSPTTPTTGSSGPHSSGHRGPRHSGPRSGRPPRKPRRQYVRKRKVCRFCVEKMDHIDYKNVELLQTFILDRGKVVPRRITGTCSRHQRWLKVAIKRARNIALLPFAASI